MAKNLRTVWIICAIFLISILIRIPGLFESLWWDEVYRTHVVLNKENLWGRLFFDVHNFLYNGFMYIWINLFGDSELSIRIPSLFFGYTSAMIFCAWISRKFNNRIAIFVGVLILFSPFHVWYSTEAKNNSLVILFAVLIFTSYSNVFESARRKWLILAFFAGVFGIFTDFLLSIPLLAAMIAGIIYLTKYDRSKDKLIKSTICFASTILCILPLVIFKFYHMSHLFRSYLKPFNLEELFLLLFNYFPNGNAIFPVHAYGGLANISNWWQLVFLVASSFLFGSLLLKGFISLWKKFPVVQAGIFFIVPVVSMYLLTLYIETRYESGHYVYLERSLASILFYFYVLILVLGAYALRNTVVRAGVLTTVLSLSLAGTGMMLTVNNDQWTVYKPNPDWRSFANDTIEETKCPLVFTSCPHGAMDYYMRGAPSKVTNLKFKSDSNPDKIIASLTQETEKVCSAKPDVFYVAINEFWGSRRGLRINKNIISRLFSLVEKKEYLGLEVYKYAISKKEDSGSSCP